MKKITIPEDILTSTDRSDNNKNSRLSKSEVKSKGLDVLYKNTFLISCEKTFEIFFDSLPSDTKSKILLENIIRFLY